MVTKPMLSIGIKRLSTRVRHSVAMSIRDSKPPATIIFTFVTVMSSVASEAFFFDDFSEGGFEHAFALTRSIGDHYLPAYLPIVTRHRDTPFSRHHREFQLYRRGRYVEFNLVYDRGTLFGLQSGGRIESILMSLPPNVSWRYDWRAESGSPEADLVQDFLRPRYWLAQAVKPESS